VTGEVTPAEVGVVAGHVMRTPVPAVAGEDDVLTARRVVQRSQLALMLHVPHPAVVAGPHQLDEPGRRVLEPGRRLTLHGHREVPQLGDGLDRSAGLGVLDGGDLDAGADGARHRAALVVDGRVVRTPDTDQGGRSVCQGYRERAAARRLQRTPPGIGCTDRLGRAQRGEGRGGNSGHAESGPTTVHHHGSVTNPPRNARADGVSRRYTTFVERHTASPVIVTAATTSVVPRKFGPPESP
jgi:hypothetical protein